MENGKVCIYYIDGRNPDGTDHVSKKFGTIINENTDSIVLKPEDSENSIKLFKQRIIRIEIKGDEVGI